MEYVKKMFYETDFSEELIINYSVDKLKEYLRVNREKELEI